MKFPEVLNSTICVYLCSSVVRLDTVFFGALAVSISLGSESTNGRKASIHYSPLTIHAVPAWVD